MSQCPSHGDATGCYWYFLTRKIVIVTAVTTTNLCRLMNASAMRLLGPATVCGAVRAAYTSVTQTPNQAASSHFLTPQ